MIGTVEFDIGWVFTYDGKEYPETSDVNWALVGNAPLIVDRSDGQLYVTGSFEPVEHYVEQYRKGIRRRFAGFTVSRNLDSWLFVAGTIMALEDLELLGKPVVGHQLLSTEKKHNTWIFRFAGNLSVATESAWRLLDQGRIVVTSMDDGHKFGLPEPIDAASTISSTLVGRTVEAAAISAFSGDLTISFSSAAQLQLLQLSGGYESWNLTVQGSQTICLGGGRIAHFPGHEVD